MPITTPKAWIIRIFTILILVVLLVASPSAHASGELTTSSDSSPGQVQTKKDGDAIYLSTNVNPIEEATAAAAISTQGATASTSASESGTKADLLRSDIVIPTGYASDIGSLINSLLTLVMVIATLLVFLYLIWGGIQWITSGGDKSKTEAARSKIFAAVIGLIILAASYAILLLALRFLGFSSIKNVFENVETIS